MGQLFAALGNHPPPNPDFSQATSCSQSFCEDWPIGKGDVNPKPMWNHVVTPVGHAHVPWVPLCLQSVSLYVRSVCAIPAYVRTTCAAACVVLRPARTLSEVPYAYAVQTKCCLCDQLTCIVCAPRVRVRIPYVNVCIECEYRVFITVHWYTSTRPWTWFAQRQAINRPCKQHLPESFLATFFGVLIGWACPGSSPPTRMCFCLAPHSPSIAALTNL